MPPLPVRNPCASILVFLARSATWESGTDSTRVGYAAHVLDRDSENEIAGHEIGYSHPLGSVVDLIMGGGRQHFLPSSEDGKREDDVNLIEWAKEKGWVYAADKGELAPVLDGGEIVPLPFLGLFASSHMSYELDRDDDKQPSLLEMTKIALASLEKASKKGKKGMPKFSYHQHRYPLGTVIKCRPQVTSS